ncbi:hypothetical protein J6590_077605 [Homalodisca vitripennis]|nr:hypothetical protein J6590_077605 [Homalodisca vitripennis]
MDHVITSRNQQGLTDSTRGVGGRVVQACVHASLHFRGDMQPIVVLEKANTEHTNTHTTTPSETLHLAQSASTHEIKCYSIKRIFHDLILLQFRGDMQPIVVLEM